MAEPSGGATAPAFQALEVDAGSVRGEGKLTLKRGEGEATPLMPGRPRPLGTPVEGDRAHVCGVEMPAWFRRVLGGLGAGSRGSSCYGATWNLTNAILGSGILGLPFAVAEAGFLPGMILLVVVAWMTDYTLRLLVRMAASHGKDSYEALVGHAYGRVGWAAVGIAQFLFAFGALVSYAILVRESLYSVAVQVVGAEGVWGDRSFLLALAATFVLLPISLARDFSTLANFSALSLAGVFSMVSVVVYLHVSLGPVSTTLSPTDKFLSAHEHFFSSIGTFAFAFVCQHQATLIYDSLTRKTVAEFDRVARSSLLLSVVACAVMGIFGYLTFFEHTRGDVFVSFDRSIEKAIGSEQDRRLTAVDGGPASPALASIAAFFHGFRPAALQAATTQRIDGLEAAFHREMAVRDADHLSVKYQSAIGALTAAKGFLVLNMLLTFPAELFVCRETIIHALDAWRFQQEWKRTPDPIFNLEARERLEAEHRAASLWRREEGYLQHVGITLVVWASAVGIALVVEEIGDVLELSGAVAATMLAFILPPLTHLRSGIAPTDVSHPLDRVNWPSIVTLAFGVVVFFAATIQSVIVLANGRDPITDDDSV